MFNGVTLCGCGWLGTQLASYLSATTRITGTTRSSEKASALREMGISPLLFELGDPPSELARQCVGSTVVLNIPPGRKHPFGPEFADYMNRLIDAFMQHRAKHLTFISTTSVYGESVNGAVTEVSDLNPETDSAKAHVAIEQHLQTYPQKQFSIIRLAGLVGTNRHPVRYLSGKSLLKGERRVNLVHADDVISALAALIQQGGKGQTLHLCSNSHPTRGDYYQTSAERLGLALPRFNDYQGLPPDGKYIDATLSWQALGITPRYTSPYDMLDGIML
ncbi:NAD-dependent epimerase/dehydratase family protein [Alteromonas aestuariivivens]|uniref:NAD-dependent epimerase/dehydratase family protein n=1 Tax=Alteromonas aestuariivivens TaxID=1938339 RepID=A0A3D8M2Y3_9ALTE|nr:NAD-dependent epimerase/dehydratase family protein [Alteromonas aestuariivivens]RDV24001.1 NAD-dependent epimerase/dehydratase family protein [Alteromonas aestuariivivens]